MSIATTKIRPHFKPGQRVPIFQRPISHGEYEGHAVLVKFIDSCPEFDRPDLIAERWVVRFDGETGSYLRVVTEKKR